MAPRVALGLLALGVLLAFGRCAYPGLGSPFASPAKPNVVLIVSDDMRFDGLWVMKNLNALAERGVVFTRFYTPTPLCCPSRASFMTGLYARHHGVLANTPPLGGVEAFDDHSTLATWLHSVGVRTGLAGRYLNGYTSVDVPPGWDFWFAIWQASEGHGNYYNYRAADNGDRRYFAFKPDDYSTRVISQQALRFLSEDRARPFMLMITPRTPHGPATPDPLDSGVYKDLDLPLPPSYDEEDVSQKPSPVRRLPPLSTEQSKEMEIFRRHQLEALLGVDRMIGSLVEALRADGRLDNTWIFYSSDNGLTLGEHRRFFGKSCPYEECVSVPLVVIPPPGIGVPHTDDHLVANIDLAPTIASIMGARPDATADGLSLLPIISDPSAAWRDALLLEMLKEDQEEEAEGYRYVGVRTPTSKYVTYPNGEEELYDELADPYELKNLAKDPAWVSEKARLSDRLNGLVDGNRWPDRKVPSGTPTR